MPVYLEYRLEKSNIPVAEIGNIRIYTKEEWIFQDLRAELAEIFPTAVISSFSAIEKPGGAATPPCDMVFIPFMSITDTFRYKYSALRGVLKSKPRYIGFYELGKRHLIIEKRKSPASFITRKLIEYGFRFILRVKNKTPRSKTGETRKTGPK